MKVYGPGVDPNKVREQVPVTFTVDTSKAGKAPLGVQVRTDRGLYDCTSLKFVNCFLHTKHTYINHI